MFKKLAIIGLTTALIGCGTSNRVLADTWINELLNPTAASLITGILHMRKPAPTKKVYVDHNQSVSDIYRRVQQDNARHDQQIDTVLSSFPHRAYDVYVDPVSFNIRNRQVQATIGFVVKWNQQYLRSLHNVLTAASNTHAGDVTHWATLKTGTHWGDGAGAYKFDRQRGEKVIHGLYQPGPQLLLTVGNRSMGCFDVPALSGLTQGSYMAKNKMVQPSGNGVTINGWLELRSHITLTLTAQQADNMQQARISVVNRNQCR